MSTAEEQIERIKSRYERNLRWRKLYEEGATLREIAAKENDEYTPKGISLAIVSVGGTMRPAQRRPKRPTTGILAWLYQ